MAGSSSRSSGACFFSVHGVLLASLVCGSCLFGAGEASGAAHRVVDPEWHPATATWYGSAEGDGSDGETSLVRSILTSSTLALVMTTISLARQRISNGECVAASLAAPKLVFHFLLAVKTASEQ